MSRGEPCVTGACGLWRGLPFLSRFLPFSRFVSTRPVSSLLVSSLLFSSRATDRCSFVPSFSLSLSLSRLCLCSAMNCAARAREQQVRYALNVAQEDRGVARTMDLGRLATRRLPIGQWRAFCATAMVLCRTHKLHACVYTYVCMTSNVRRIRNKRIRRDRRHMTRKHVRFFLF